jgi:arsenate reductase-like glutaredoxin family protein
MDDRAARDAVLAAPTLIKRPLLDTGKELHVGFSDAQYREIFHQHTL